MKLYKNCDLEYTLVTHDNRLYKLSQQGSLIITQFIGKVANNAIVSGVLQKKIPNHLKTKCFTLNSKHYGKPNP